MYAFWNSPIAMNFTKKSRHMTDSCWKCHRNSPQQIGSRYTQNTTGCGATLYEVGISCASVPDRKFKPSREVQRRWTLREKTSEGWKAWFIATDGGDSFAIFKGCGCMFSVFTVAKQNQNFEHLAGLCRRFAWQSRRKRGTKCCWLLWRCFKF